jgi:hypothetical protein
MAWFLYNHKAEEKFLDAFVSACCASRLCYKPLLAKIIKSLPYSLDVALFDKN